jgi:hypothetical protein
MTETSDTSTIDDKKKESNSSDNSSYISNIGNFLTAVITIFIVIILYFSGSGALLYACKIAQSNILPTEKKCYPYEDTKPNIQPIETNIFTTFTDPMLSLKLSFPYDDYNSSNKILDMFRDYKNQSNSYFLANYLISIIESLMQFNFSLFNNVLNMLNGLPEILLLFIGPFIFFTLLTFFVLFSQIYLIYLWFANMSWFFKTNTNDTDSGKPNWEDVSITSLFNYACAIGLVILFIIIFITAIPLIPVLPFLVVSWCFLSCLSYKSVMNDKSITVAKIIQDIFKHYKVSIMSVLSFLIIVSAFRNLGSISGLFAILTLVLIYFGIISINLFKPITSEENFTKITSYDQAKKTCSNKDIHKKKGGIFSFFQGGGNIKKELKNINKKFQIFNNN